MKQTKLTKNKTTKYLLLGLVPAVLVPLITLAAIYGSKTTKKQTLPTHSFLNEKEVDEIIVEEVNNLYDEGPISEVVDFSQKPKITGIVRTSVKRELDEASSIGITIDKMELRDIIKKELDDALLILEVNLDVAMKKAFEADKEADVQVLYSVYNDKHRGARKLVIEKLAKGTPSETNSKLLFLWPNKQLKTYVEFHHVYHKEQLINLIRDIDAWVDYHIERNNLIKTLNREFAAYKYGLYSALWDTAFAIQESYLQLDKEINGWTNLDLESKLGDEYKYNLDELEIEQEAIKNWIDNARTLIANELEESQENKEDEKTEQ